MNRFKIPTLLLLSSLLNATIGSAADSGPVTSAPAHRFEIGPTDFLPDGQRLQIRCGEIHFARVPCEYWSHLTVKLGPAGQQLGLRRSY